MKRLIITLSLIVGMLMPGALIGGASSASAATCVSESKYTSTYTYTMHPDLASANAGTIHVYGRMYYRDCGTYGYFDKYSLTLSKTGYCGLTRNVVINPDAIGGYNGGAISRACQDDDKYDYMTWNPTQKYVSAYSDYDNRCIKASIKMDNAWAYDRHYATDKTCMSLRG